MINEIWRHKIMSDSLYSKMMNISVWFEKINNSLLVLIGQITRGLCDMKSHLVFWDDEWQLMFCETEWQFILFVAE